MVRLLVLAMVVAVGVLPSSTASAVSISVSPSSVNRSLDDFSVAIYEVFLNADGFTDGITFADVTLTVSGAELLDPVSFGNDDGNPFPLSSGRLTLSGSDPSCPVPCGFFGGIVLDPDTGLGVLPTPTGTEVFKLGELHLVHVGTPGVVTFTLDGPTSQWGTTGLPDFDYSNEGAIVATLTVPEPGILLLVPVAAASLLRVRRSWSRKVSRTR